MKKIVLKITDDHTLQIAIDRLKFVCGDKPMQIYIEPETRTLANNRQQWPLLNAIADQLLWPVNGAMSKLSAEEFKQILTTAYRNETVRVAQGVDGGLVMLGHRTREFKRSEWQEWQTYLEWFCADRDVKIPMSKSQAAMYE